MLVTLLTATGARPESFALCERWIKNQTYKGPLHWLVVDDYIKEPTKFTCDQEVVKASVQWELGKNTQQPNMEALLEKVKGDIICVIEDDDFYAPNYIETMIDLVKSSEIAGLSCAKYYHITAQGYLILQNYKHASLSQTVIKKSLLKRVYRAVQSGNLYMDISLWQSCRQDGIPLALLSNSNISIGIKGMPVGRAGISNGHKAENYKEDPELNVLKGWLGDDHKYYLPFVK